MNITQSEVYLLDRTLSNLTDFFKKRVMQKRRQVQKWDRWVMRIMVVTYITLHVADSFRAISLDGQTKILSVFLFIAAIFVTSWYYGRKLNYYDRVLADQPRLQTLYELARQWTETAPYHQSVYVLELCDALEKQDFEKITAMMRALELFNPALANTQPIKFILEAARF